MKQHPLVAQVLDKNGALAARKTKRLSAQILEQTSFLPNDSGVCERVFALSQNLVKRPSCICGSEVDFWSWREGYRKYCGRTCAGKAKMLPAQVVKTRQEEKAELRRTSSSRAKVTRSNTNLLRRGVSNHLADPLIRDKILKTKRLTIAKLFQNELKTDGYEPLFELEQYSHSRQRLLVQHRSCGTEFELHRLHWTSDGDKACPTCFTKNASKIQHQVNQFIRSLGVESRLNDRKVFNGKIEIDIYCPHQKIAVEVDGLFWHSEKGRPDAKELSLRKYNAFKEKGLTGLFIFDDDWVIKRTIVENRLRVALGLGNKIFARRCTICDIDSRTAKKFFEDNHLSGYVPGPTRLGLFYNEELVSCLVIGQSRFGSDLELLRFTSKDSTVVVGGLSRLLSKVKCLFPKKRLITFADRRWGDGRSYAKVGFTELAPSEQSYFYVKNGRRYSRQALQKHKLKDILKTFDSTLSERDNCFANGFYRVWTAGNSKFEMLL